jgi:Zn-dependent protease/CBS domain-containing protein
MESGIYLGRVWGIPIRLHMSWFIIFFLVTWSLAAGYFPTEYPSLGTTSFWIMGAITSILFAASVLLHELGHSYVALRHHVPVRSVTLFLFGGVAQIEHEPDSAAAELRIAVAGPLTSVALAALFGGLYLLDSSIPFLAAPSAWLARINFMLAAFNMIPGFPLDGGRVLRAMVWSWTKSLTRATRVAVASGQIVALSFMGIGLYSIFNGDLYNGVWLAFIGWFLQNAASSTKSQSAIKQALSGVHVEQVMSRNYPTIPCTLTIEDLVENKILGSGGRIFLVKGDGDACLGLLTINEVRRLPRKDWPVTTAADVMVPYDSMVVVKPQTELLEALTLMDTANVAQLPVTENGSIAGILSREQILRYVRLRAEVGA